MSKHFVNTNPQQDFPNASGWGQSAEYDDNRIPKIIDTVQGGMVLQKMGTSIPHPFARLFVFQTAFNEVNKSGHNLVNTSYAKLVSECLDLLEFLYQYGSEITVKAWGQSDINNLKASEYSGHKRLADALDKAIRNLSFTDAGGNTVPVGTIFLFYYKGVLLGGTSPYSLVFTSPNIRKNLQSINAAGFTGLNGNSLFQDYSLDTTEAIPLNKRSDDFRNYLYDFYFAYQILLNQTSIGDYISENAKMYDANKWNGLQQLTQDKFVSKFDSDGAYELFKMTIGDVETDVDILRGAGGNLFMPLAYKRPYNPASHNDAGQEASIENAPVSRDYEIRPDVETQGEVLPLVLNSAGMPGATLVNGQPLPEGMQLTATTEVIEDRTLPTGQNIKYPYIYADDLLEDGMIQLPYSINSEGFMSVECNGKYFLVPVKPLLLKYFKVSSLAKMFDIRFEGKYYKLTLNVPVHHRKRSLCISKAIKPENVVNLNDGEHFLGLAVFPSYRVTNDESLNIYKVMVNNEECVPTVEFLKGYSGLNYQSRESVGGTFFDINESFDAIRIEIDGVKGLVVPKFKEVQIGQNPVAVGIDFGTTNTFVCIKGDGETKSLSIDNAHQQVMTLNRVDLSEGNRGKKYSDSMSANGMEDFYYAFMRQFVPQLIGTNESVASFPYRTVVCETKDFSDHPENSRLLSDLSIGFNYLNESIESRDYSYVTNIKWLLDTSDNTTLRANQKRVEAFVREIAWLVKNAIMLSEYPTKDFKVFTTYPGSMSLYDISEINIFWKEAFRTLVPSGVIDIDSSIREATAPFLYILGTQGAVATNTINVDIGGGTTDILYIDAKKNKMYADSSRLAGNDLWGDGIPKVESTKCNGFVQTIENLVKGNHIRLDEQEKKRFEQQKKLAKSSADVMSYIFRNEEIYTPNEFFKNERELKAVLLTHFSALCYHIAKTIQVLGVDCTNLTIRFSGFGSKYVRIVLPNDIIVAETVKQMFKAVGIETGSIKVESDNTVSPKEITARGAVIAKSESVIKELRRFTGDELTPDNIALNFGSIDKITFNDMSAKSQDIIDEYLDFVNNYLTSGTFSTYLRKDLKVVFSDELKKSLTDLNSMSVAIKSCSHHNEEEADDYVSEDAFFWPLKETLVNATKIAVNKSE